MFENNQNAEVATLNPLLDKQFAQSPTQSGQPLAPAPPNSEKRLSQRLGPYQFSMEQRVGSGMSGQAYVGINTQTHELVCIKIVDRQVFKTAEQELLLSNEIRCQQACNSDYTIRIYDIFDTSSFCFIVTEFCQGGDLYRCLRNTTNGLSQLLVVEFGREIALALRKLKEARIVHRDIKSENILIQKSHCKLGDFGFAIEQKNLSMEKKFNLGSPLYMSIEALELSSYSYSSDVFAFGIVLYEMLHRESPWECTDERQLLEKMKTEEPVFKSGVSEELKALIGGCLQREAAERPTIEQILDLPLFRELPL